MKTISFFDACHKKSFDLLGDDIVELSTKNESLKNKIGTYDEKWLKDCEASLLEQIDDEKLVSLIMSRVEKQTKKQ